jgi:hypothetical protein
MAFAGTVRTHISSAVLMMLLLPGAEGCLHAAQLTPVNVGHVNDGGNAYGIAVAGHYAYLANYNDGLRIYDISNAANPVSVGHINNGLAAAVAVTNNLACVADSFDGLRIYDISNPTNPVSVGNTNNGATALGVAVAGNFAYLANDQDGLRIYDISNPSIPLNVGHSVTNSLGTATGVAVSGNFAYLANNSDGLRIYDVSNPANCTNVGSANDGGLAFGVTVAGNYAYLANGFDGLRIYDVSNPSNPASIGNAPTFAGNAIAVALAGNYACLANFDDGLRLYNVYDPANPFPVSATNNGGLARGIAIAGNYAYLANGSDGLEIYLLRPELSLTPGTNNSLVLSWPAPSTGFILQQNPDLTGTNWATVTNVPAIVSGQFQLILTQTSGSIYYRLELPPAQTQIAPAPLLLQLALTTTNAAVITWPAPAAGFVLQQSADATTTNWAIVANVPVTVGSSNQVTISPLTGNAFFRLAFMQPSMSIASGSNSVSVSWPAYFTGFTLQQNAGLAASNWTGVTNAPAIVGGQNQVTISPASGNMFFRLKSQ